MVNFPLPRLDKDPKIYKSLLKYCRLQPGEIWSDPLAKHRIGCIECTDKNSVARLIGDARFSLAVHDPPYNIIAFKMQDSNSFVDWCREWITITDYYMLNDCSLYIWLGADQKKHFEPFAEFIIMMKDTDFKSRSFITMRNQRGYGTQKNWMSIRQELLYYIKGNPKFNTSNVYTNISKVVKGYYKEINGKVTENIERSRSDKIRAGNVWIDIQQVFHLKEENVNGCFAQKPVAALDRIVKVSSGEGDNVLDFFSHSGTTLISCEKNNRNCYTVDIDPIYCEISIRRLERYRQTGLLGWQNSNPFENEIKADKRLQKYLNEKYNIKY